MDYKVSPNLRIYIICAFIAVAIMVSTTTTLLNTLGIPITLVRSLLLNITCGLGIALGILLLLHFLIGDGQNKPQPYVSGNHQQLTETVAQPADTHLSIRHNIDIAASLKNSDNKLHKAISQIASAEKLAALGMVAAGVAHEINNPLGGILLYANLVVEDMEENDSNRENMIKIINQTHRCKEIVQHLLNFAKAPTGAMLPVSINLIIKNTLQLVRDQAAFFAIDIITELEESLPDIQGDILKLEEVFLNLLINAADAMDGKGSITIQTRKAEGDHIQITLTDTGSGIDKSYLPHIFEPFFTTKEPGHGTGLGLSIVYGIIHNHKGSIHVESELGKGASFAILLPVYNS